MKKFLSVILAGITLLSVSVFAETEYQFDIIFEPDYYINVYSFDGQNVIAEEYQRNKTAVYNQKMEKVDEYDGTRETAAQQNDNENNIEEIEILQRQMKEKYGYGCMSEFKNGFSFVNEQEVNDLPLGYKISNSYNLFFDYISTSAKEEAEKIAKEYQTGYKFIDADGNVILDNLDANVFASSWPHSMTEPGGGCMVTFNPSYFTEYGISVVKRDGKFGIINTSGNILCDFVYDGITIYGENIAIIRVGDMQKFYYINSGQESEFTATSISPLSDNFFNSYTVGGAHGVVDSYGNMVMPNRTLYALEGNNTIAYESRGSNAANSPPNTFYNRDFEVVCYDGYGGTYDKDNNIIWKDFQLNTLITNLGGFKNNIYVIQNNSSGIIRALAAINEIPKPIDDVGDKYISIMFNNPLININGKTKLLEENNYFFVPLIEDDRTLVPLRCIFEALESDVQWDEEAQTVTATKDGIIINFSIDKREMYVNGNIVLMDVPARLINNRTFVPLRAVSEAFGANVEWNEDNQLITIIY